MTDPAANDEYRGQLSGECEMRLLIGFAAAVVDVGASHSVPVCMRRRKSVKYDTMLIVWSQYNMGISKLFLCVACLRAVMQRAAKRQRNVKIKGHVLNTVVVTERDLLFTVCTCALQRAALIPLYSPS